jgi:proteasome lid subunit RPN8/RPN11
MFSRVKIKRGALDHFRKKARAAFPLEIQAYMIGKIVSVNEIDVTKIVYTTEYGVQTRGSVSWYLADLNAAKIKASKMGQTIVGDIHSHPSWDAVMSKDDYAVCIREAYSIQGIVSVSNKKRTRIHFWTPNSALECQIVYI